MLKNKKKPAKLTYLSMSPKKKVITKLAWDFEKRRKTGNMFTDIQEILTKNDTKNPH